MQVFFLFLLEIKKVFSDLSLEQIKKVTDEVFKDENLAYSETIINPVFGFLADRLGFTYNLRFFSPAIQTTFINKKREYIKDMSEDPLTSLIIKLYPSPAGFLTASTLWRANPLSLFRNNIENSVKFFSSLFIAVIKNENFDFEFLKHKNESKRKFETRIGNFNEIRQLMMAKSTIELFADDVMIKLIIIHSYIIRAIDPVDDDNVTDYFKIYLQEIVKGLDEIKNKDILNIKVDENLILNAIESYNNNIRFFFPYSKVNPPQSQSEVPSYFRTEDKFDKKEKFSDCTETTLLQLCNCLFYKDRKYSVDHLNKCSKELKNFYNDFQMPFTLTDKIRMRWLKVVSDLPMTNETIKLNYPTENISYIRSNNNEIKQSIINMMNVLITITGIDKQEIFKDINEINLFDKFKILIDLISVEENGKKVAELTEIRNLSEIKIENDTKRDFFGTLRIKFQYNLKNEAMIEIISIEKHVELQLIKTEENIKEEKIEKLDLEIKNDNLLEKIITKLIFEHVNKSFDIDSIFESIFLSGFSITNKDKFEKLEILIKTLNNLVALNSDQKQKDLIENIGKRIMDSIDDFENLKETHKFTKFMVWRKDGLINNALLLIDFLFYTEMLCDNYIKDKCNIFLEKQFECIEIIDDSYANSMDEIKIKKFIFNKIEKLENLEKLEFFGTKFDFEYLTNTIKKLKECKKLKTLSFRFTDYTEIPTEIGELTSLVKLDFSDIKAKSLPSSIENLPNLEELDLSANDFNGQFPSFLSNLKNIKTLDISNCDLREIPEFALNYRFLENLNLRNNEIEKLPKSIPNWINMKKINFNNCGLKNVPEFLKEFTQLEELELSRNNFEIEELDFLQKRKNLAIFT